MFEDRSAGVAVFGAASPDELLDEVLVTEPGPWTLGVLDGLRDDCTTDSAKEKLLAGWERFTAWAALQRAHAVVGAAASQQQVLGPFGADDFGADVIALITGVTTTAAANDLTAARTVIDELPGVYSALHRGQISWQMAREAVEHTATLRPWQRETVDQQMIAGWNIDHDITAWRRKLRRQVLRVNDDADLRRREAVLDRKVMMWPLPDGMAAIHAELRAEDAILVMTALSSVADKYAAADRAAAEAAEAADGGPDADEPTEPADEQWVNPEEFAQLPAAPPWARTTDQRRADALVDICDHVLADPTLPKHHGRRSTVQATGGILTLLGLREDPGELTGYGPITAQHLREIAADADWHRFCTAPDTGELIAIGRDSYRPNQALRDFLLAAHPHCDFTGCRVPAHRTDADHTTPHHHGGPTDDANVRPRCRRHHRAKTHAGWSVQILDDGSVAWTTPAGTTRTVPPHRLAGDDIDHPPD